MENYKHTALGWIPNDWEIIRLGEYSFITKLAGFEYSLHFESYRESGEIIVLRGTNIANNKLNLCDIRTIPSITSQKLIRSKLFIGDLVFAYVGTIGPVFLVDQDNKYHLGPNTAKITAGKSLNTNFLFHYFTSNLIKNEIQENVSIGAQPSLSMTKIREFKILIPSLPEQKLIADCLGTWDTAIDLAEKQVAAFEQRKKYLMQVLLSGKKRLPSFTEEWKTVQLGEVFERVTRKNINLEQNVVTISAQKGFVKQTDFFSKSIASETLDNYYLVYNGEFCYNKSYSNGYPLGAVKRLNNYDLAVVTTLYICFKIKSLENTCGNFFEHYFEANLLNYGLLKVANEGGRAHGLLNVTATDFFNIVITIPSYQEQTAIAAVLTAADNAIGKAKDRLQALKTQKRGLMQVLLTGKKRLV